MNILMISDVYYPRINGVSTSIATFRRELHAQGHQTLLLAPQYPGYTEPEDGIIRVTSRYLPFDPEDRVMRTDRLLKCMRSLPAARFDIVHVHTPFQAHRAGVRFARRHHLPVIETYHTFFEEYFHHYLPLLPDAWLRLAARALSRRLGKRLDAFIVPSRAVEQALNRYGIRIPVHIIPTGLDLAEFTPGDKRRFCQRHKLATHRPTLVYVGRVAHEKNIGFLLDVVDRLRQELPEVLLVIAGEGPASGALQRRATQLRLTDNVAFVGYLPRGQPLWDCYAAGDAFVFASKTETQGLVLLEALALGVPVVSTAKFGSCDVLKGCGGTLLAQSNVADFTAQALRLLRDPELRRFLSEQARTDVLHWSIEHTTAKLVAYYASLIEDSESAGGPLADAAVALGKVLGPDVSEQ